MLRELRIENLLLIERAELRLGEGLNAITGETGAGKTILAHSLDLLMGGRARPQIVRPGAAEAWVEGVFDLPEELLADEELADLAARLPDGADEVVLGRRVGANGRTAAFVAGRAAAAADLQALGRGLLAFFGQHEHRKLTLASAQLEILDAFCGGEQLERRRRYREAYAEHAAIARQLDALREREGGRERDLDLLRFELAEIEAAAPDCDEAAGLAAERERLRHAEGLRLAAGTALAAAAGQAEDGGGAVAALASADAALAAAAGVDAELDALAGRVRTLAVDLDDIATEIRSYLERVDAEPGRLELVAERLDALDRLRRKHGGTIESVLEHAERCRAEIERLDGAEERAADLERRLAAAAERRLSLAAELTEARRAGSRKLAKRVAAELEELAMEGASLKVGLERHDGLGPGGAETAVFQVATNPGMPASPLRDAASGGELSRVMLALTGLGRGAGAGTLAFDEIDAGIGGETARAVGERLRALADDAGRQVLCITHLPQVASLATTHFRISKSVARGEARAEVERVEGEELVAEICRMLGAGRGDKAAARHARELLAAA